MLMWMNSLAAHPQLQVGVIELIFILKIEIAFIRLEDTYQWAADLLLQQSSAQRSMRNKAELITSENQIG